MVLSELSSIVFCLVKPGARLRYPLEPILYYGSAVWFVAIGSSGDGEWGAAIAQLALTNAILQVSLFLVVVQIPCYVTGKMSNVDLAWPSGLVLLAAQVLRYHFQNYSGDGDGDASSCYYDNPWLWNRSFLVAIALLMHGGRMAFGALVLFFPFDWPNGDLSRYKHAKKRWATESGAAHLWYLKQQQETIQQAYANSVLIAAPVILVGTNNPNNNNHLSSHNCLRPMEVIGIGSWLVFWILENVSDVQMLRFRKTACSKDNGDNKNKNNTRVLGYAPYDGWRYFLWTKSRHPNYFFEWMCWNSLIVMAIPSALDLAAAIDGDCTSSIHADTIISSTLTVTTTTTKLVQKFGIWVLLYGLSRTFYDCLLYWTGAEPAESQSVKRRPLYKEYQKITNVFFPVSVPFFDHHRKPGWPAVEEEDGDKGPRKENEKRN